MRLLYDRLHRSPRYKLILAAGAGHHDGLLGNTLIDVQLSGLPLDCILPVVDGDAGVQSAAVLSGMTEWLERRRPDALLIMGDRFEMLAGAQAALLAKVPVVHIGGGHLTLGAIDDRVRHAVSKLSALHFVASKMCAERVIALHEDPRSVHVTGAPELDAFVQMPVLPRHEFCGSIGLDPSRPFALVTVHPETNVTDDQNSFFAAEVYRALVKVPHQILITAPCADPGNRPFLELCHALAARRRDCCYVPSLGLRRYVAALHHAAVVVGNSSSGIIEAATVGVPVVNIGERQRERDRAENVLDCPFQAESILRAVSAAVEPAFVTLSRGVVNPYGDGTFASKALALLDKVAWPLSLTKPWLHDRR